MWAEEKNELLACGNALLQSKKFSDARNCFAQVAEADPSDYRAYQGLLLAELCHTSLKALIADGVDFYGNPLYLKMMECAPPELEQQIDRYRQKGRRQREPLSAGCVVALIAAFGGLWLLIKLIEAAMQ